jgi:hypothetical protein
VFAGWLGMFAATSPLVEGFSNVGFPALLLFMLSAGISTLRRQRRGAQAAPSTPGVLTPAS